MTQSNWGPYPTWRVFEEASPLGSLQTHPTSHQDYHETSDHQDENIFDTEKEHQVIFTKMLGSLHTKSKSSRPILYFLSRQVVYIWLEDIDICLFWLIQTAD
jgi:hypothetical protein